VSAAASGEHELAELLERAGARIRGHNRADCPRCKRQRAVSFDESKGVYHCHGQGCDFFGGTRNLARELGLYQRLSLAEYRQHRRSHERADRAARALYDRTKARRFEVLDELDGLNRLELQAHDAGTDHRATWGALAWVYAERPGVLAELAILENLGAAELLRFVSASPEERERSLETVILRGGLCDLRGRFVEVAG